MTDLPLPVIMHALPVEENEVGEGLEAGKTRGRGRGLR